jgi:hypothetical protein
LCIGLLFTYLCVPMRARCLRRYIFSVYTSNNQRLNHRHSFFFFQKKNEIFAGFYILLLKLELLPKNLNSVKYFASKRIDYSLKPNSSLESCLRETEPSVILHDISIHKCCIPEPSWCSCLNLSMIKSLPLFANYSIRSCLLVESESPRPRLRGLYTAFSSFEQEANVLSSNENKMSRHPVRRNVLHKLQSIPKTRKYSKWEEYYEIG